MVLQLGEQQSQQASTQGRGIHQSHATQHRNMAAKSSSVTIALNALANPIMAASPEQEETLQCVTYSGPCFFMNHPNGSTAPTRPVAAAKRPNATDEQLRLRPTPQPLRPFSLHNVTLLSGTRFHTAQRTNVEWLRKFRASRTTKSSHWLQPLSGSRQPTRFETQQDRNEGELKCGRVVCFWLSQPVQHSFSP